MNHQSENEQPANVLRCQSDHAFTKPGEYLAAYCGVCGQKMTSIRNVLGPTGSVEAMSCRLTQSKGHLHDQFFCDDRDETWHRQAKAIQSEACDSPSKRLADLLTEEAKEIVRTRKATKESFGRGW